MSTNLELNFKPAVELPTQPAVDIRYGQIGLLQVRVRTTDPGAILDELTGRIATVPHFFRGTAVCLDLGSLESAPTEAAVRGVIDAIRRAGMATVGVAGTGNDLEHLAAALALPVLSSFRAQGAPVAAIPTLELVSNAEPARAGAPPEPQVAAEAAAAEQPGTLIHPHTVRSGQRLYARNRDLVVTAMVSAGAEVMTDGCLHVYGPMRGRAMAGARGNESARLFCQEFHAELVSIAGVFRVFETIPAELAGKPVQVWLAGDNLRFARIGA
ncbi:MAG: septum site-determining protein MinC [Steroidobacteraceae bacterium]